MTPLTKEQAEALADRIEARAARMTCANDEHGIVQLGHIVADSVLTMLATEIRDGTFIEVRQAAADDEWGCEYCRNDGALSDSGECPRCGAEYPDEVQHD